MADDVTKPIEDMFGKLKEIEAGLKALLVDWHTEACAAHSGFVDPAADLLRSFAVKAVDVARDALILCAQLEVSTGNRQNGEHKLI